MPKIPKTKLFGGETDVVQDIEKYARSGSKQEMVQTLREVLADLQKDFGTWRLTWGELNRFQRISNQDVNIVDDEKPEEPNLWADKKDEPKSTTPSTVKVTDAEKRLNKTDTKSDGALAKDLNKALSNISDAKKKIEKAAVQSGKMSQKDLDSAIAVATKIAKGIDLNEKEKAVADTYIRIKDKKEDTSIYILFPPFNTQNHAKIKMGNLDRLLAYGKKNGIKTTSQGSSDGSDASADKQKLPKKAMAGANINKKTVDTIIKGDENSVTFGETGTKIEKVPEYSKEEQSQFVDKLIKSGMNPEKAVKLVERVATESERHNKVIDFFKKSPSVKTLDFGAEPTTDEGRSTIIKNSKQQSIAQFEKFFKKAIAIGLSMNHDLAMAVIIGVISSALVFALAMAAKASSNMATMRCCSGREGRGIIKFSISVVLIFC